MATQKTDQKRGPVGWMMVAVLVVGIGIIIWYLYPRNATPNTAQRYYSDDDGTTWFADDPRKVPPFMHNGKEAVIAMVYQTEKGSPFVAYLEKYTDDAKAKLEASANSTALPPKRGAHSVKISMATSGMLVKKPHGGSWVPEEDPSANDIKMVKSPDGSTDIMPLSPD